MYFYFITYTYTLIIINNYFSRCYVLNTTIITIIFNINYINVWFTLLIIKIFYIIFYLLLKKTYSYIKQLNSIISYFTITLNIILLLVTYELISFFIFLENLIVPILYISIIYGFTNRFIFAVYYLIFFSGISSILTICTVIILVTSINNISLNIVYDNNINNNFIIIYIYIFVWIIFGIKYPIWPLHIWLPELHVEVNTESSILLASIVLKLGYFGIIRFIFLALLEINNWYINILEILLVFGLWIIVTCILYIIDYKKTIAYWSVIHTCISLNLLWFNEYLTTYTTQITNLSHILSAALMFKVIGILYETYNIRIYLSLHSMYNNNYINSIYIILMLYNIDFPHTLLFYIDIFIIFNIITVSIWYIIIFINIFIIIFISTCYLYLISTSTTSLWNNNYIKLDIVTNDIFIVLNIFTFTLIYYYYAINI